MQFFHGDGFLLWAGSGIEGLRSATFVDLVSHAARLKKLLADPRDPHGSAWVNLIETDGPGNDRAVGSDNGHGRLLSSILMHQHRAPIGLCDSLSRFDHAW
jgi:hypothetical protein